MQHFGDITKLKGNEIPKVDIICGGSPCQDLSVAGKREGLAGERSGLFMEQIRIIKEMREDDRANGRTVEHIRPRFMVWENVPGAFSSNKGEDFRCVLEETAKIADSNAAIPRLATGKDGKQKWSKAGAIMGDGWSIAWRVHDAQFWGVPQRRKRIALVADFAGECATEILFERKGVSRDIEKSREEGQGTTTDAERNVGETSKCLNSWDVQSKHIQPEEGIAEALYSGECRGGGGESYVMQKTSVVAFEPGAASRVGGHIYEDKAGSLRANAGDNQQAVCIENHPQDSRVKIREDGICQTLDARMGMGGGNVPMVMESSDGDIAGTLDASYYKGCGLRQGKERTVVAYANEAYDKWSESEKSASLRASGGVYGGGSESLSVDSVVRRLTPLECERLQGYPDGWTDIGEWYDSKGKKHKDADSPRYKALGNSIALPFWQWMAEKMVKHLNNPTMGSLFDGIGGFPLVYSRVGCQPLWASEIEEFPMAVTKIRFPDNEVTQ